MKRIRRVASRRSRHQAGGRRRTSQREILEPRLVLDTSPPPILQWFEGSYNSIEQRVPDIFAAGYGAVFTPPPGRADSGNQSVGYDVYNRFDLGSPGDPTLYGTEAGMKAMINAIHQTGDSYYSDLVWNHDGFEDQNTPGFAAAGGYPGFALYLNSSNNSQGYNDPYGDFHDPSDTSTTGMRLAGLIDIAQEKNYQFIRSPVGPNPDNIPAGSVPYNGRLANVPTPSNAQFYPDHNLTPITFSDPATGQSNVTVYPFNLTDPMDGTPEPENATGYLMRYTQWMVQVMGVDGFRLDAAKNMPQWVLNYYDQSVFRASNRTALNGSQEPIFSFGEVYDSDKGLLQSYVNKSDNGPNVVGGDRDVLDFPLFFALQSNLSGNGYQNNWNNVVNASVATELGDANNGAEGVSFVSSADNGPPDLQNVAYAYTLTHPGNTIVYFNGHEFGPGRNFPQDGRGDALGGLYGNTITNLVNIRNTHPDGNYDQRYIDQNVLVYERDDSMLVGLSNRTDSGFDTRTVHTDFAPGTYLLDLTGLSANLSTNEDGNIKPLLQVDSNGNVTFEVPRNSDDGNFTGDGYIIYAPASPQGTLTINGTSQILPGGTPTAATNGTTELSPIDVVTGNSFQIQLNTNAVNLLGNASLADPDADGDNSLYKIDGGDDAAGTGFVDTNPGDVAYGFQQFTTVHDPGYGSATGNGEYVQTINTANLSNGYHYIDVRAFRHRDSGEPPIFTDFKITIYVDHSPTTTQLDSFNDVTPGVNQNKLLTVEATDSRVNNVHVLFDLPAGLTDTQILSMIGAANQANQIDRNLWTSEDDGLTNGNHVVTVVSYQIDGTASIQRFTEEEYPFLATSTIYGAGLGDLDFNGAINAHDVDLFGQVLESDNQQFNPAADFDGDGQIDNTDLLLYYSALVAGNADANTMVAYQQLLGPPSGGFTMSQGGSLTLSTNRPTGTSPPLSFSWSFNNDGNFNDATGPSPTLTWSQLLALGISQAGVYPITLKVDDGADSIQIPTMLDVVVNVGPQAAIMVNTLADKNAYGFTTLREAITQANASPYPGGTTVTFAPGLSGTIALTQGELPITQAMTIAAAGAGPISITGGDSRVFDIDDGNAAPDITVSIGGLTLSGGNGLGFHLSGSGGAVYNAENLTLSNDTIIDNTAPSGGGVFNESGTLLLTNDTISGNSAQSGGGVDNNTGVLTATNDTIAGNTAQGDGGGIENTSGTLNLLNNVVVGNSAASDANVGGTITTNTGNVIDVPVVQVLATDSNGQALLADNGGPTPTIALVVGSPAIGAADPLATLSAPAALGDGTFIVSDPTFAAVGDLLRVDQEVVVVTAVDTATNTISVTRRADGSTAAAHAGGAALYLATDQRGLSRNAMPDIGAFETQTPTVTVKISDKTYDGAADPVSAGIVGTNSAALTAPADGTLNYAYYSGTLAAGDLAGATQLTGVPVNAGSYTVVAQFTSAVADYRNSQSAPTYFTISPAAFTYAIGDDDQAQGVPVDLAADLPGTFATGVHGETLSIAYSSTGDTAAATPGQYQITGLASDGTGLATNYAVTLTPGTLTVEGPGAMQVAGTLFLVGGNGNDQVFISPTGTSSTGSTGVVVWARLNGAAIDRQAFGVSPAAPITSIVVSGLGGNDNIFELGTITIATTVVEGNGNDSIALGGGNNSVTAGDGNDYISAGGGNNTISAGNGNDNVQLGQPGWMQWFARATPAGNNTITLGNGNDHVSAGGGNNVVTIGNGNDNINLGNGNNTITVQGGQPAATHGGWPWWLPRGANIQLGNGNNTVTAGDSDIHVNAGSGSNTVTAGNGNDTVRAGANGWWQWLAPTATIGGNVVTLGDGNDQVFVGNGNNTVSVGDDNDFVQAGNGNNVIVAGNGDDNIQAGNGDNLIVGGGGQDRIFVGDGDNILIDGSVTQNTDQLWAVLEKWMSDIAAHTAASQIAADLADGLTINYNTSNANTLRAGRGFDAFYATYANDRVNAKPGDLLNGRTF